MEPLTTPPPSPNRLSLAIQRLERVLDFADAFGKSLLVEFRRVLAAPPARVAVVHELGEQLRELERLVDQGRRFLVDEDLEPAPMEERLAALAAYPIQAVSALAATIEGLAKQARAELAAAAEVAPEPAAAPAAGGPPGTRQAGATVDVRRVGPRPLPPPPGSGGPGGTLERARQAFEAARQLVAEVLAYVSPRLAIVRVAMQATGLPGRERPWPEAAAALKQGAAQARLGQGQLAWLPLLARLFVADADATRKAHVALVHWSELKTLHAGADRLAESLETAPPARQPTMLRAFNLGRYRANAHPLGHLHLTFADTPHLQELFPPP